jgi:hypothetical protein
MNQSNEQLSGPPSFAIRITREGKTVTATAPTLGLTATGSSVRSATNALQRSVHDALHKGTLKQD